MKLAIFDFDGTLFSQEILPFFLSHWGKSKYSKVKYLKTYASLIPLYIKYKFGLKSNMSREQMKITAMEKFNYIFDGMIESEIMEFFIDCSKVIKDHLNETIVFEVRKAQSEGYHTVLLSGTYYSFLKYIGEYVGFDTVIGTEIHFKNGIIDLTKKPKIISGVLKLEKTMEEFEGKSIDWDASEAYADSYSDLHILESVGEPVAVNPDDKLRSIAIKNSWRIIS